MEHNLVKPFKYVYLKLKPILFVKWRKIPLVLILNMAIALIVGLPFGGNSEEFDRDLINKIIDIPLWRAAVAGLEEVFFVLPLFLLPKKLIPIGMTILGVIFVYGHSYQGTGMYAKIGHVPLGYMLASQYGIITTILAHAFQDIMAIGAIKAIVSYLVSNGISL